MEELDYHAIKPACRGVYSGSKINTLKTSIQSTISFRPLSLKGRIKYFIPNQMSQKIVEKLELNYLRTKKRIEAVFDLGPFIGRFNSNYRRMFLD